MRTVCEAPGQGCTVGARPIAPFGPDRPRLRHRAPIGAPLSRAPSICTLLASPSFATDTVAIRMLRKTGVELQYGWVGLHHGTIGARLHRGSPIGPRLHRRAPIREDGPGRSARILGGCGAVGDIARAYFSFFFWPVDLAISCFVAKQAPINFAPTFISRAEELSFCFASFGCVFSCPICVAFPQLFVFHLISALKLWTCVIANGRVDQKNCFAPTFT